MLVQILTRMGQSVRENVYIDVLDIFLVYHIGHFLCILNFSFQFQLLEESLLHHGGDLLYLEELDLQDDQILLAAVQILLFVAD